MITENLQLSTLLSKLLTPPCRLVGATDPLYNTTIYTYDAKGQQTATTSPLGAQNKAEYDSMGRLVSSTDANNNETTFEYDVLGRLIKTNYADGTSSENLYNANGWLTETIAQYDSATLDKSITGYTHNKNGQVLTITDAKGGVTAYGYDELGRTVLVTNALNGVTASTYDENGNLLTSTDPLNGVTEYQYDELNRVISTTDALGNISQVEYDANGNVKKITNADGGEIEYSYDLLDRLTSYIDTEGYTFSFTYDSNGNTVSATDGRNKTTSTQYDALNRPIKQYDQLNNYTVTTYDADGRMQTFTDAENAITNYSYYPNGNIKKVTDALGNATNFTYDSMNRVATMTNAKGAITSYTYTATGQVETITDALGGVKSYEYDKLGNLLSETNELGKTTAYTYDALSRPLTVTNPLGHTDSFAYDLNNRITSVTDKTSNITQYVYDANGNIVETIDALSHSSYFEYDEMNRLTKVTLWRDDARHSTHEEQITLYQYDKRGLVVKEINAAEYETLYVYDGNGNLVKKTDASGYVTKFSYDPRNLISEINYSNSKGVAFYYNNNGELITMADRSGAVYFALDALGRIIEVNDQFLTKTSYSYDTVGNQTSITYPDNTTAIYTYDQLNRMINLNDAENQNTSYQYDAASQLIAMIYPNGWDEAYTYDDAGQLLTQLANDPSNKPNKQILHTYAYDPQGNILNEARSGAGGQDKFDYTHTYDALNRLTKTSGLWGYKEHTYEYDSLGNLLYEKNANGAKKGNEYWYNNLNQQIAKLTDDKDSYSYIFDRRGNLIKGIYHGNGSNANRIEEQYVYDAANRMVKGSKYLGTSVEYEESHYVYNGFGYLLANEWLIAKNNYGYHGLGTNLDLSKQKDGVVTYDCCVLHSLADDPNIMKLVIELITFIPEQIVIIDPETGQPIPNDNSSLEQIVIIPDDMPDITSVIGNKNYAVVHKDYVLDYTSPLKNVIMEVEKGDGGLTYRYTYGLQKNSVTIYDIPNGAGSLLERQNYPNGAEDIVKLYYHHDHLGSTDYLTDNIAGKVTSYATYDDWGELTAKAIVKMGLRMLDLVQEYTGHPYDQVLGMYYAKARMYDAADRRFMAKDWAGSNIVNTQTFARYNYALNNPIVFFDRTGLKPELVEGAKINVAGGGVINVVYVDANNNNSVYVNFYEALEAWGIDTNNPKFYKEYDNGGWKMILSLPLNSRFSREGIIEEKWEYMVRGDKWGMYLEANAYDYYGIGMQRGVTMRIPAYQMDSLLLVNISYFAQFMCNMALDKKYSFNDVLNAALNIQLPETSVSTNLTTNSFIQTEVWKFFIGKGFTPAQAAGIMGNAEQESSWNPLRRGNGSGYWGLFQINRNLSSELEIKYQVAGLDMTKYGYNVSTYQGIGAQNKIFLDDMTKILDVQLNYIYDVKPTGANWITPLKNANSSDEAAEVFLVLFEGAVSTTQIENNKIKFYKPYIGRYYQETAKRRTYAAKY